MWQLPGEIDGKLPALATHGVRVRPTLHLFVQDEETKQSMLYEVRLPLIDSMSIPDELGRVAKGISLDPRSYLVMWLPGDEPHPNRGAGGRWRRFKTPGLVEIHKGRGGSLFALPDSENVGDAEKKS